jgi:cell volume regulation protein A
VERIGVAALIVILFDGGLHLGWRRVRSAAVPILSLGVAGTFTTAALVAAAAHLVLGFSWTTSGLIGAAVAPTDPAVMFSVLGEREPGGRSGVILKGESGANDPVGIALMIGMIDLARHPDESLLRIAREFTLEMTIGAVIGVVAALASRRALRIPLPSAPLYPLRALSVAGMVYGIAGVAGGSGFLAVFILGLLLDRSEIAHRAEVERFHTTLASLAELVVFIALGLTVHVAALRHDGLWSSGIVLALMLTFVARPLAAGPLLALLRLTNRERVFIVWGGLRGAVPILLAALAVVEAAPDARDVYGIVFVVVAFSVLVQGSTVGAVAERLRLPLRPVD